MNWFELSVKSRANESVPVSLPTIYSPCTNISDRRCSCKLCTKGYYRNKTISKCLSYSGCCLDEMDEVVSQCVDQRLPRTQTCSYHNRNPCGSKCWYDEITVLNPDGKHSCQPCPVCSKDMGLTVPCGGLVRDEMLIGCERPTIGKTFVNQQGVLQSCNTCSSGRGVKAIVHTNLLQSPFKRLPGVFLVL